MHAHTRVQSSTSAFPLQGAPYGLTAPPQFPALCAMVMDQALTDHLDLAFNNHMCVLVASR